MNVLRTCYKYYKQRYLPTAQTRLVGNSLACWKLGYIAWNQCLQASVNLGSPRWPVKTDFGCSFSKHLPTVNPEWELANSQIAPLFLIRDCTSRSTATIFPKCHIFSCVRWIGLKIVYKLHFQCLVQEFFLEGGPMCHNRKRAWGLMPNYKNVKALYVSTCTEDQPSATQ